MKAVFVKTDTPQTTCQSPRVWHLMLAFNSWLNMVLPLGHSWSHVQYFLGCWMTKVRGEWGFSTAGCTLLCLTLTGISGKSWLSCKKFKQEFYHQQGSLTSEALSLIQFIQMESTVAVSDVCFTLSRVPDSSMLTCCILLEVARDLLQDHKVEIWVSFHFKANFSNRHAKTVAQYCKICGNIFFFFKMSLVFMLQTHARVADVDLPQLFWALCLLFWSPMGGTLFQTFLDHPFTSSFNYWIRQKTFKLILFSTFE